MQGRGYNSRAGTKRGRGQYHSAAHAVLSASVCALYYDTRSSLLPGMSAAASADISAAVSLPPLQVLQCTRPFSVPQCDRVSYLLHLEPHPPHVKLSLCGHYSSAGFILLSSARVRSAGSIRGREEIEEIWYITW